MRLAALPRPYAVVGLLAGLLSRAVADCNHNNCLRAVIGNAYPTRDGVADCNSYLLTTVTPATSTFFATSTITASASTSTTEIDSFTTVIVIPETTTSTETTTTIVHTPETVATDTSLTTVIVETVTSTTDVATVIATETDSAPAKARRGRRGQMRPRQVTAVPTAIPAYASSCPSPAAYVSACLCYGATAQTITVAAPSTTITLSTTTTTTSTILTTTSTTSTTSSTSTTTASETDTATSTIVDSITDSITLTVSSTTTSIVPGTTTTTTTTTSAAGSCATPPSLANGGFEQGSLGPWVYSNFGYNGVTDQVVSGGDFTPASGNYYFDIYNGASGEIEVRLAQSSYFCAGVAYKVAFEASGKCGSGSCAGSGDLGLQITTFYGYSQIFQIQSNAPSGYTTFEWTFTWNNGNTLSPVMFDLFIDNEGESIAIDNIAIGYA